jgi:hypothetical protein
LRDRWRLDHEQPVVVLFAPPPVISSELAGLGADSPFAPVMV